MQIAKQKHKLKEKPVEQTKELATEFVKIGQCRGKEFHAQSHDHHSATELKYCRKCNDIVPLVDNNTLTCYCCRNKIVREPNYLVVKRILNQVCKNYFPIIDFWALNPLPKSHPVMLRIDLDGYKYQVDCKYAVLYLECQEMNEENRRETLKLIHDNIEGVYLETAWGKKHAYKITSQLLY